MLTFEQIKELIEQVADRGLQGLEVERSGFRLKIDGQTTVSPAAPAPATEAASPPSAPATNSPAPSTAGSGTAAVPPAPAAAPEEQKEEGPPDGSHVLKSPIVGTFYRRPAPDADPYVSVGDRVKTGQVLCIVEAMKLMNEIESDVDGEILEIYPKNAQAVEYGEPLFAIRPD